MVHGLRVALICALACASVAAAAAPAAKKKTAPKSEPVSAPAPAPEPVAAPAPAPAPALPPAVAEPAPAPVAAPAEAVAVASGKPRLVILGLTAGGGVEPAVADSLSEAVAASAARTGLFEVSTQKDISTMLGLERQKQLLGCSDEAQSCLAELAGAIGARFVLNGSVTRLGDAFQLNLQTIDTVRTQTLGRTTRIASDLKSLRAMLPSAFAEASATPAPPAPSNVFPVVLMGAGAAAALAAGVVFFQSYSREQAAVTELELTKTQPQLQLNKPVSYYRDEANAVVQQRIISAVLLGVGVALAVVGIVLYKSPDSGTQVSLLPKSNGFAFAGVLP